MKYYMGKYKQCKVVMRPNSKTSFSKGDLIKLSDGLAICMGDASIQDCGITQHLYFISQDKRKKGQWGYCVELNVFYQPDRDDEPDDVYIRTIVATTEKELGLPLIPESFLQAYVITNGDTFRVLLDMNNNTQNGIQESEPSLNVTENNEVVVVNAFR